MQKIRLRPNGQTDKRNNRRRVFHRTLTYHHHPFRIRFNFIFLQLITYLKRTKQVGTDILLAIKSETGTSFYMNLIPGRG